MLVATYKVIQDIEAEDKLLGPLTLRQFIYAAIVFVMGFVAYKLAAVNILLVIPFLLPMGFFTLLAAPFGQDQSSEVWLLAKIGFMLKPRRRIWDQTGMQQLVTITAPKRVEEHLTDGLTQTEVKSRLQALANTIDSRGWAVKNVNVNLYDKSASGPDDSDSDRLIGSDSLPQAVPNYEIVAADDMLDETSNPTAQHLNTMITQSEQAHRQDLVSKTLGSAGKPEPADYWFMNQPPAAKQKPGYAMFNTGSAILPGSSLKGGGGAKNEPSSAEEQALLGRMRQTQTKPNPAYGHMRVLNPDGSVQPAGKGQSSAKPEEESKAEIARLAVNDDLNVSTIARQANKATKQPPDDEVVISLR